MFKTNPFYTSDKVLEGRPIRLNENFYFWVFHCIYWVLAVASVDLPALFLTKQKSSFWCELCITLIKEPFEVLWAWQPNGCRVLWCVLSLSCGRWSPSLSWFNRTHFTAPGQFSLVSRFFFTANSENLHSNFLAFVGWQDFM